MKGVKKVHLIGVCGTLMGAFAAYLKRHQIDVTGSDQNIYPPMSDVLKNAGIQTFEGYRAENLQALNPKPDLVVIGNVIQSKNPEARAAIDGGYAYTSLPEAMEKFLLQDSRNLVVSGTHGKTTTSSLLAHVLKVCGKDPSYFIGGVPADLPVSFQVSNQNEYFVLEGDEYDTAFWDKVPKFFHYLPDDVILTSIEYDHADIYPNLEAVVKAFRGLIERIRVQKSGNLIACVDYPEVVKLLKLRPELKTLTYGMNESENPRFRPVHLKSIDGILKFTLLENSKPVADLSLNVPGQHNVLNATAVWILARQLGLVEADVNQAIASFHGVKRRQEVRGVIRGVTVIDDFAHHPTAVRETLRAFKERYPKQRLIAVFEPRSATSRRKVFQKQYSEAFQDAGICFISKPHDQSNIASDQQFSSEQLVEDIHQKGVKAELFSSIEAGVERVAKECHSGDIVLVLSNGGFGGFIPKLLDALS